MAAIARLVGGWLYRSCCCCSGPSFEQLSGLIDFTIGCGLDRNFGGMLHWLNDLLGFEHKLDAAGLITAATAGSPLFTVGRFLLSSVPSGRLDEVRKIAPRLPEDHLWQLATDILQATVPGMSGMPKGSLWPEKLLELNANGGATVRAVLPLWADIGHRPAGHEAAADDSGKPLLLVYPVGPRLSEPYVSVTQPGLAERMKSLVGTMFSAGAVASTATVAPTTDELIMAGHSSGNLHMWIALAANGADIAKCVAFDAAGRGVVPEDHAENIRNGVNRRHGRGFTLVLVTSPNSGSMAVHTERVAKVRAAMRDNPAARLHLLPAINDHAEFWNPQKILPATAPTKNPVLQSIVASWPASEVTSAADKPQAWNFLFFHEFAAYGGQSLTRTFFRGALDL